MKVHELRTWPDEFQAMLDGRKPFDIRNGDRDFQVDDILILREFEICPSCLGIGTADKRTPCSVCQGEAGAYTGRKICRKVTYILNSHPVGIPFGLRPGYVALGVVLCDDLLQNYEKRSE